MNKTKLIFISCLLSFSLTALTAQNVGIGTNNPTKKLDVNGSVNIGDSLFVNKRLGVGTNILNGEMVVNDADQDGSVVARYITSAAEILLGFNISNQGILGTQSDHDLRIRTAGVNRMTIKNTGEVGIGTTSPTAPFHVRNNGNPDEQTIVGVLESAASNRPTLLFSENSNSDINSGMSIEYDGSGSGTENRLSINKIGGEAALTVNNEGYLGIGTINPLTLFDLRSFNSDTISEQLRIWQGNENGNATIRMGHGFSDFNNYIIGIDHKDKRFKISPALSFDESIDNDPALEIDKKGELYFPNLGGSGSLYVTDSGRVFSSKYRFHALSIKIQNFENLTTLILPDEAEIYSIRWYYVDQQTNRSIRLRIREVGHQDPTPATSNSIGFFESDVNGASPDIQEEIVSLNSFHMIDNVDFYYEISVDAAGTQSEFIFLNSVVVLYRIKI